jgi:threonine dehydrogenase-like Zn-dependent dehydrogenase
MSSQALWCVAPGRAEIRPGVVGEGATVTALYSGISRGTERLVFKGGVPETEYERMRAPFQEGDFPFPVKYGYAMVGRVEDGALAGKTAFSLHPHQARFRVPEDALVPLPEGVPAERSVLAANMETALNIIWDSQAGPGDRIAVVGCGVVGALVGYIAARIAGTDVTLIDVDESRAALAQKFSCAFAAPDAAPKDCDVVINTSASEKGLQLALEIAEKEATVVEASWYGSTDVSLPLGHGFHSRRLRIVSSQVGSIPASRQARWTYRRRIEKALQLLRDPALDVLISGETAFVDLAAAYGDILADPATLCHRIRY